MQSAQEDLGPDSGPSAAVEELLASLGNIPDYRVYGRVASVLGLLVEIGGVARDLSVGARCRLIAREGRAVDCELIGFRQDRALAMPFGSVDGIGIGCIAEGAQPPPPAHPHPRSLG